MQKMVQSAILKGENHKERKRVETVVETLASSRNQGESLSAVAHDARNMVSALGLYCDLIEEPGVLAAPYAHYGSELRLVAAASRRLVEKLVALDARDVQAEDAYPSDSRLPPMSVMPDAIVERTGMEQGSEQGAAMLLGLHRHNGLLPVTLISNFADELLSNQNLLSALAGPSIALTVEATGGARPVRITGEDLTRVLVNLVKNASEAMQGKGQIDIKLNERPALDGATECVVLTVEDNGRGIAASDIQRIFDSGYTTHDRGEFGGKDWPFKYRGLGLAIVRSIVEMAGGSVRASNREQGGAQFEIELPVRKF